MFISDNIRPILINGRTHILGEINEMLKQKQDAIQESVHATQSLRSKNPKIKIPSSIYDTRDDASSIFVTDAASTVALSEFEFEFDDTIVNTRSYRELCARA